MIDWLNWSDTYLDSVFFFFLNISTILLEIKKEEEELRDPTKRKFLEEMLFGVRVAHTRIALWPPPCDIDSILSVLLNLPTPFHKRKKKITRRNRQHSWHSSGSDRPTNHPDKKRVSINYSSFCVAYKSWPEFLSPVERTLSLKRFRGKDKSAESSHDPAWKNAV